MGIKGLLSFLQNQPECWLNIEELRSNPNGVTNSTGTPLIIDGNNIAFSLNTSDFLSGGQLVSYYEKVHYFYLTVIKSGFTPIVIHYGIMIHEKQACIFGRELNSMADYCNAISKEKSITKLTSLGHLTYEQVLKNLNIKVINCDCEEDNVIASLAVALNAPVLSNDSDFYAMNLRGVLNMNKINFTSGKLVGHYFSFRRFLNAVSLDHCMIPLVVVMLSNDLMPQELHNSLYHIIRNQIKGFYGNHTMKIIKSLSQYSSPDQLITSIKSQLPMKFRNLFEEYYHSTHQQYLSPESVIKINTAKAYYGLKYNVIIEHSQCALEHIIDLGWSWTIIINGVCFPRSVAEDYSMEQASNCSRYIRSCRNSIIIKENQQIIEVERTTDMNLIQKLITLPITLTNNVKLPKLDELIYIKESKRYEFFYQILTEQSNQPLLTISDLNWRIIACILVYWVNNCIPKPILATLKSVLIACFITKIDSKGVAIAHCIPNDLKWRIKHNLKLIHQLAQFQCVIYDTIRLLQALKLQIVPPHLFYNGDILYSIVLSPLCQLNCKDILISYEDNAFIESAFKSIYTQAGLNL